MNAHTTPPFRRLIALAVAVPLAILAAYSWPPPATGQDKQPTVSESAQTDSDPSMQCPMMMGLKGIQLAPDSPPLLLAEAQQWNLTAQQQQRLKQIANEARQKARQVLSEDQLEKLAGKPNQAMPLPQIAKQRMQDTKKASQDSKPRCPMCQKMMQKMQSSKNKSDK